MKKSARNMSAEIDGYIELGLGKEALALSGEVLALPKPQAEEIRVAISAIGVFAEDMKVWTGRVEEMLARLPKRVRHAVREPMVMFYFALGDLEKAVSFAVATRTFSTEGLYCAVSSLVRLDRGEDALKLLNSHPVARSQESEDDFVAESWALVLSAAGHLSCALNHRMNAKCDSPIAIDVVEGGIETAAALMASWLGERIEQIEKRRGSMPESVDQLTLPGNDLALLSDEEKACRRWRRRCIKMIPKERRRFYPVLGAE
jgi:hypothetical protein